MKKLLPILSASLMIFILSSFAYLGNIKAVDKNHFIIYGNVIEIEPDEMVEYDIGGVQIIVYQDNEIYCAFDANDRGDYQFNLPNGHVYEIYYGTREFVPKKIYVDANNVYEKRDGHSIKLNVALFKKIDNVDYTIMEEPMSKFSYEKSKKDFEIDFEYAEKKLNDLRDLYKEMKKMKKKNFKEKKLK